MRLWGPQKNDPLPLQKKSQGQGTDHLLGLGIIQDHLGPRSWMTWRSLPIFMEI